MKAKPRLRSIIIRFDLGRVILLLLIPSWLTTSHGFSVRFLFRLELVPKPSVMLSVYEIVDASCQGKRRFLLMANMNYTGFEIAHIFPSAYEGHWIDNNYGRWITVPPENGETSNSAEQALA